MDVESYTGLNDLPQMLPPPPGSFADREELIQHVGDFAVSQGYVVTIKQSKRDRVVKLGCDRGGVQRDRQKTVGESSSKHYQKRKVSRQTNFPFEALGKKCDGLWVLTIKNGTHNHEPLKDISEHPSARRFNETEVLMIKEMTESGLKPRQILKRLRQSNPDLVSTPRNVYNVKAKLRQGNLEETRISKKNQILQQGQNSNVQNVATPQVQKQQNKRRNRLDKQEAISSHQTSRTKVSKKLLRVL